jgi:recombination protein RecT
MASNSQNMPAKQPAQAQTVMALLESDDVKSKLAMAIPKHLTVDRLLRVAMSAIRVNPTLLKCTPQSLVACVMGCAQLGLEPEPFLGQAYMVPFKKNKKLPNGQWESWTEAQLIPGYRGYIALARRSGEVQTVMAQAVFANDIFRLRYGVESTIEHEPAEGDRGTFKGAYVVFKYKDGSYSFDYMSKADIDKIRARSKSADKGPWVTDYEEMAKKTVIRRHIKLTPLAVENTAMAMAAEAESRAMSGKSQINLFATSPDEIEPEDEGDDGGETYENPPQASMEFDRLAQERGADMGVLARFTVATASMNQCPVDDVKAQAIANFDGFWEAFQTWQAKQQPATPTNSKTRNVPTKAEMDQRRAETRAELEGRGVLDAVVKAMGDKGQGPPTAWNTAQCNKALDIGRELAAQAATPADAGQEETATELSATGPTLPAGNLREE